MTIRPTRRQFFHLLLGGSALAWLASVLYPVAHYFFPPKAKEASLTDVKVASATALAPNSGKIVRFGSQPAILIRKPDGSFAAFSAKCTHLDCIVQYRPDLGRIYCACHSGQYDLNGTNVAGPPPRPLEKFDVRVQGDDVFLTRPA